MMAGYTALAFVAVLFVPRGAGEADTGPESAGSEDPAVPSTLVAQAFRPAFRTRGRSKDLRYVRLRDNTSNVGRAPSG